MIPLKEPLAAGHPQRLFALLAVLALAACSHPQPSTAQLAALQTSPALQPYVLQVDDQIAVKFYRSPEMDEETTVRPDGMISLQLIGDVPAAGQSPEVLGAELVRR